MSHPSCRLVLRRWWPQHASFGGFAGMSQNLGEVSRPEALAYAGQDVAVRDPAAQAPRTPVQGRAGDQPTRVAAAPDRKAVAPGPSERPRKREAASKKLSRAKSITTSGSARVPSG